MQSYYSHTNLIELADPLSSQPFSSALHTGCATSTFKKRKIDRACDACRRRKTKCDGPRMPDNICTNCVQNRKACSYLEASKPRGPPKAYITNLEDRLEKMEALLKRLRPEADFSEELGPPVVRDSWKTDTEPPHEKSSSSPTFSSRQTTSRTASTPWSDTDSSSAGYTSSDTEQVGELSLSRGMKRLTIRGLEPAEDHHRLADNQVRFHGKSSCYKLIEPTRKLRDEHLNRVTGGDERTRDSTSPINPAALRRTEFWTTLPWELAFEGFQDRPENLCLSITKDFPPQDLADTLIKLYFEYTNSFIPIFHRPTFERQWKQGLQHWDAWFGCLCLSIFAVASRWSDDPRVLDDGKYDVSLAEKPIEEHRWQRAGWKFFNAAVDIHRGSHSLFHPAGLFEVQTMALLGIFLRGTAFHPSAWLFVSIGLRKAQDLGAHRKKIYGDKPSIEGELWKRAFWSLVLLDRLASATLGRPCSSGEEEFDAELPLEVDDEYWEAESPEKAFKQPHGKPSEIAAFNSHLKLTKIVAYAMRTIYALDRSKLLFSVARPRWQDVLAKLNHAMTEWVDSVPKHLHWSPHINDPLFSSQSATLYITYYLIQIIIYRPFLPPSLHSVMNITPHSNMPIPCIGICVNAGKCVSRILKAQISRGYPNIPCLIFGSHVCAAILLMNFWDLKWQERNQMKYSAFEDIKSPLSLTMAERLAEISVFIEALEAIKSRWKIAEDYLNDLSTSLPHSLGGSEPSLSKSDASPDFPPQYELHAYHNTTSPDYTSLGNYRNPPPDYPIVMTEYAEAEPSERSPHFFDVPHITRYPVPSTLPIPPSTTSCEGDQFTQLRSTAFQSQQNYNSRDLIYTKLGDQTSVHSRPTPLFSESATDETPKAQRESSISRQYGIASRVSCGGPASASTHCSAVSTGQSRPDWASDWDYNPIYAVGPNSGHAVTKGGTGASLDETHSAPGHY